MGRLGSGECYRVLWEVDVREAVASLPRLQFIHVNQGQTAPEKYACDVVLENKFPPELAALLDGLELGGERARAVLRRLSPGQSIPPHIDAWMPDGLDWRRFQVPLTSHPEIRMRWPDDGQEVHLQPGWLYEVRYDRTHEVVNRTECERVHLQIDQVGATI